MTTHFFRIAILISAVIACTESSDVPTEKAKIPKMNPRPQMPKVTHKVFLDVEIEGGDDDEPGGGKIILGLFGGVAPKTVENFRSLCSCDKGNGAISGKPLCYKGTTFHRIIVNFMVQGGDFTHGDGVGGESIYGGKFEDESFLMKHNIKYLLSMANSGPDTNGSQFFINTVKASWLDDKHVAFGMVLDGEDVVDDIEEQGTKGGKPRKIVTIKDSGEIPMAEHVETA